jgi:5'-3' exoribonuclease 1
MQANRDIYYPSFVASKRLRISGLAMSKVASRLDLDIAGSNQRVNVGLCLKFDSKSQKVLGYSRKTERGWEYSQTAIDLVERYMEKFPEIFQALQRKSQVDFLSDQDVFYNDTKNRISQVKEWLKIEGVDKFPRVSLTAEALTKVYICLWEGIDRCYGSRNQSLP